MSDSQIYNELVELCNYDLKEVRKTLENLESMLDEEENWEEEHTRVCSECKERFTSGYCIENGLEYYCSDECLHKHYSDEEWQELYDNGESDSYWTTWA